jgi:Ca2+/Na+ antiporter
MTGKNIQLTVFILLATICLSGSVYLFWTSGHFNFWMFLGAWIFASIGVLVYYSEKSEHSHEDPYAHDHDDHHDVAHH